MQIFPADYIFLRAFFILLVEPDIFNLRTSRKKSLLEH